MRSAVSVVITAFLVTMTSSRIGIADGVKRHSSSDLVTQRHVDFFALEDRTLGDAP